VGETKERGIKKMAGCMAGWEKQKREKKKRKKKRKKKERKKERKMGDKHGPKDEEFFFLNYYLSFSNVLISKTLLNLAMYHNLKRYHLVTWHC
jgi:hypothetical protein